MQVIKREAEGSRRVKLKDGGKTLKNETLKRCARQRDKKYKEFVWTIEANVRINNFITIRRKVMIIKASFKWRFIWRNPLKEQAWSTLGWRI